MLLEADNHVVNCLQPHPYDPSEYHKKQIRRNSVKKFRCYIYFVFYQFLLHLELTMTSKSGPHLSSYLRLTETLLKRYSKAPLLSYFL